MTESPPNLVENINFRYKKLNKVQTGLKQRKEF